MKNKGTVKFFALILSLTLILGLCGCQVSTAPSTSQVENKSTPEKILAEIKKDCTLPDMRNISEDQLDVLYGIDKSYIAYFAGCVATDSLSKDEIVIIEAMDEGEANTIRDRLQNHYDKLLEECKEYLPEEYKIIKKCSVVKKGIYISLFISSEADKMTSIFNSYIA